MPELILGTDVIDRSRSPSIESDTPKSKVSTSEGLAVKQQSDGIGDVQYADCTSKPPVASQTASKNAGDVQCDNGTKTSSKEGGDQQCLPEGKPVNSPSKIAPEPSTSSSTPEPQQMATTHARNSVVSFAENESPKYDSHVSARNSVLTPDANGLEPAVRPQESRISTVSEMRSSDQSNAEENSQGNGRISQKGGRASSRFSQMRGMVMQPVISKLASRRKGDRSSTLRSSKSFNAPSFRSNMSASSRSAFKSGPSSKSIQSNVSKASQQSVSTLVRDLSAGAKKLVDAASSALAGARQTTETNSVGHIIPEEQSQENSGLAINILRVFKSGRGSNASRGSGVSSQSSGGFQRVRTVKGQGTVKLRSGWLDRPYSNFWTTVDIIYASALFGYFLTVPLDAGEDWPSEIKYARIVTGVALCIIDFFGGFSRGYYDESGSVVAHSLQPWSDSVFRRYCMSGYLFLDSVSAVPVIVDLVDSFKWRNLQLLFLCRLPKLCWIFNSLLIWNGFILPIGPWNLFARSIWRIAELLCVFFYIIHIFSCWLPTPSGGVVSPSEYEDHFWLVISAAVPGMPGAGADHWKDHNSAVKCSLLILMLASWTLFLVILWIMLGGTFENEKRFMQSMGQLRQWSVRYEFMRETFDLQIREIPSPSQLREEIAFSFFGKALMHIKMIQMLEGSEDGLTWQLAVQCGYLSCAANRIVFCEGEAANEMIIVKSGLLRLLFHTLDADGEIHASQVLPRDSVLGELELLYDVQRSYTVQCLAHNTELVILTKDAFNVVCDIRPAWRTALDKYKSDIMCIAPQSQDSEYEEYDLGVTESLSAHNDKALTVQCPRCHDSQSLLYFLNTCVGNDQNLFGNAFDTFLSHSWDETMMTHGIAEIISKGLSNQGMRSWLDTNGGCKTNITLDICKGVDCSSTFSMVITRDYLEKVQQGTENYCGAEFNYAMLRLGVSKMICIVIDDTMTNQLNWFGPVAFRCGNDLYINFSGVNWNRPPQEILKDETFKKQIAELSDRIGSCSRGKVSRAPSMQSSAIGTPRGSSNRRPNQSNCSSLPDESGMCVLSQSDVVIVNKGLISHSQAAQSHAEGLQTVLSPSAATSWDLKGFKSGAPSAAKTSWDMKGLTMARQRSSARSSSGGKMSAGMKRMRSGNNSQTLMGATRSTISNGRSSFLEMNNTRSTISMGRSSLRKNSPHLGMDHMTSTASALSVTSTRSGPMEEILE